jgi:hypothetical protein
VRFVQRHDKIIQQHVKRTDNKIVAVVQPKVYKFLVGDNREHRPRQHNLIITVGAVDNIPVQHFDPNPSVYFLVQQDSPQTMFLNLAEIYLQP